VANATSTSQMNLVIFFIVFPFYSGEEAPGIVFYVGKCEEGREIHSIAFLLVHLCAPGSRLLRVERGRLN